MSRGGAEGAGVGQGWAGADRHLHGGNGGGSIGQVSPLSSVRPPPQEGKNLLNPVHAPPAACAPAARDGRTLNRLANVLEYQTITSLRMATLLQVGPRGQQQGGRRGRRRALACMQLG